MTPQTLLLSDGSRVHVLRAGTGLPVLLIHGVGLRAEAWGPQMTALAQDHAVYAVDLPGHGGSDPLGDGAELADYAEWAAQVIDSLGCGPMVVVGHSMGAMIAAALAIWHPAQVAGVALLNPVHRRDPAARAAVLDRAEQIAAGHGDRTAPLDRWFDAGDHALRAQVGGWLRDVSQQGYAAAYAAFALGDVAYASQLHRIRCPLLALTGADDGNSTPTMTHTIAAQVSDGRAVVVPGHRHMVNLTAPEAVTRALRDWLAQIMAPTPTQGFVP